MMHEAFLPSIKTPRLAKSFPPLHLMCLTVDLDGQIVPVDHSLPSSGVAPHQVVALSIHQHVKHLACTPVIPIGLEQVQINY